MYIGHCISSLYTYFVSSAVLLLSVAWSLRDTVHLLPRTLSFMHAEQRSSWSFPHFSLPSLFSRVEIMFALVFYFLAHLKRNLEWRDVSGRVLWKVLRERMVWRMLQWLSPCRGGRSRQQQCSGGKGKLRVGSNTHLATLHGALEGMLPHWLACCPGPESPGPRTLTS